MESEVPPPVKEIVAEISDNSRPLLRTRLAELSGLNRPELELFTSSWPLIDTKRRRQIMSQLVELAEDDPQLGFDDIFKFSLKDADPDIRSQAIEGLWENEESSLISPMVDMLEQDTSATVRAAAATALGKFAMLAEHGKLSPENAAAVQMSLLKALSDTSAPAELRRRVIEAAGPLSIPEVKRAIEDAYKSRDVSIKASAIYAMGKNCDIAWLPRLIRELSSSEAEIRYEAAGACGELEEEEAVPALKRLVDDFDADVQMAAIRALGRINNREAREFLEECLESDNDLVRQTTEQVLDEMATMDDPMSIHLHNLREND